MRLFWVFAPVLVLILVAIGIDSYGPELPLVGVYIRLSLGYATVGVCVTGYVLVWGLLRLRQQQLGIVECRDERDDLRERLIEEGALAAGAREEADRAKAELEHEREELTRNLNQLQLGLTDAREQAELAKVRLVNEVRHALLASISGMRGRLQNAEPCDLPVVVKGAISGLERLEEVLVKLQELVSLEAIGPENSEPVFIGDVIAAAVEEVNTYAEARERTVRIEDHPTPWGNSPVLGHRIYLRMLFANLISNALKYSNMPSDVTVSLHENQAEAVAIVTDRGRGISEKDLEFVAEPLFRADDVKRDAIPGLGVGLAVARRIATLHGGKLSIESKLGRGTRVTVTLPLQARDTDDLTLTKPSQREEESSSEA